MSSVVGGRRPSGSGVATQNQSEARNRVDACLDDFLADVVVESKKLGRGDQH